MYCCAEAWQPMPSACESALYHSHSLSPQIRLWVFGGPEKPRESTKSADHEARAYHSFSATPSKAPSWVGHSENVAYFTSEIKWIVTFSFIYQMITEVISWHFQYRAGYSSQQLVHRDKCRNFRLNVLHTKGLLIPNEANHWTAWKTLVLYHRYVVRYHDNNVWRMACHNVMLSAP